MEIFENYDLTKLNTFGVPARARFFTEVKSEKELEELFCSPFFKNNQKLFLGGGSNILFTKNFEGIIVSNKLKGIEILEEDENEVFIRSMGGEMWDDLVQYIVDRNYWGAENLSLIPGTVGAAPVQNIGAYGIEVKDILEAVEAYDLISTEKKIFKNKECEFGYRSSVFKKTKKYFISAVILRLSKKEKVNLNYKALKDELLKNSIEIKSPKDIRKAVLDIRKSKLPNPVEIGNAGSFFKNVFVEKDKADLLKKEYLDAPIFEEEDKYKVAAGWLIEKCGWKGKKIGNVGVHEKQALVLVNYGGATGEEIKNLSEQIISSVFSKFGLTLETEVNLI